MSNTKDPVTVSSVALLEGGIAPGNFIETETDQRLMQISYDDSPLMKIMLAAQTVPVRSPVVNHYSIEPAPALLKNTSAVNSPTQTQVILPLGADQQKLVCTGMLLFVHGVDGYDSATGQTLIYGSGLTLYVTGQDPTTNNPIVRALNGPKRNPTDELTTVPRIPASSNISILSNAMYETQLEVETRISTPVPKTVYLQKRGMNKTVSDYFDAQIKRIPFRDANIAEQAIADFKAQSSRTLWAANKSVFSVTVPGIGIQKIYTTEGLRHQFENEVQINDKLDARRLIGLTKLFFACKDKPASGILLAGKDLLEAIQAIDFSAYSEITFSSKPNPNGWTTFCLHTIFGDIEIYHEPALDSLGWAGCGALIDPARITRYVLRDETEFSDRIPGHEASRSGIYVWDAVALRGSCHLWLDGTGAPSRRDSIVFWDTTAAPADDMCLNHFYLLRDCPGMSDEAKAGQLWTGEKVLIGSGSDMKEAVRWTKLEY